MAVPRVTVDKISVRKLHTQMQKDKYAHVKKAFASIPKESATSTGTVFWEPPKAAVEGMIEVLVNEQAFSRRTEGASYKAAEESIARLRKYLLEHHGSTVSPTPAAST